MSFLKRFAKFAIGQPNCHRRPGPRCSTRHTLIIFLYFLFVIFLFIYLYTRNSLFVYGNALPNQYMLYHSFIPKEFNYGMLAL